MNAGGGLAIEKLIFPPDNFTRLAVAYLYHLERHADK